MKSFTIAVASAVVIFTAAAGLSAVADPTASSGFSNPRIVIAEHDKGDGGYWKTTSIAFAEDDPAHPGQKRTVFHPMDPKFAATRDYMIKRKVLEEYVDFISPLRLPHTLTVIASACNGNDLDSPRYEGDVFTHRMNICYGMIDWFANIAKDMVKRQAELKLPTSVNADQLEAGMFASVMMHETGHALFDLLDVPVFGREEDAADQVAVFVGLQFGKETARTVVKGFAYTWKGLVIATQEDAKPRAIAAYADVHGTDDQRMYNVLCMAYGAHADWFQDLVDSTWLPKKRAQDCGGEYRQAYEAFGQTIYPFLDQAQMAKVRAKTDWFQSAELKEK
jgi:hypothetical protein